MKFSIKDFSTFTEEIINGKLDFFCCGTVILKFGSKRIQTQNKCNPFRQLNMLCYQVTSAILHSKPTIFVIPPFSPLLKVLLHFSYCHCVKGVHIRSYSGPHFSHIFPHSVRIRENAGKMRTRITPNMFIFYPVCLC